MNKPLTADQAWDFTVKHRSGLENAPWPDVRIKNAAMYAGMKGIAQADDLALCTHYARLFREEYIRLCNKRERRTETENTDNLSPLEQELYRLADNGAALNVQMMGLPGRMDNATAIAEIRAGMGDKVTTERKAKHRPMSNEDREAIYAEIEQQEEARKEAESYQSRAGLL